jgi:hypothetical protein
MIGAGKSGTTAINQIIQEHPEVYMSPVKEPNYFALDGETKITGYDSEDPDGFQHYPQSITRYEDYLALFSDVGNEKIIGDCSNMYQYSKKAADNIKRVIPKVKLLGVFRNPAERLYSRYLHLLRQNRVPTEHFIDCFDRDSLWWKKNDLIQEGFYHKHMSYYYELFDSNQIKIMLYDDFKKNPLEFMREIFNYLEIDENFKPNTSQKLNVGGKIKNQYLNNFIGEESVIRKSIQRISPKFVDWSRENKYLKNIVFSARNKNLVRSKLENEIKNRLTNEIYKEDIIRFAKLTNKNLDHWLVNN